MTTMTMDDMRNVFRAPVGRIELEVSDEILGPITIWVDHCLPEKGQAGIVMSAYKAPVKSPLLSAIEGYPCWWGHIGKTSLKEIDEEKLAYAFNNHGSSLNVFFPLYYSIKREIERLRLAYAVAVCFEANRTGQSPLEPMPLGGHSVASHIREEWERIKNKITVSGCLFAPHPNPRD